MPRKAFPTRKPRVFCNWEVHTTGDPGGHRFHTGQIGLPCPRPRLGALLLRRRSGQRRPGPQQREAHNSLYYEARSSGHDTPPKADAPVRVEWRLARLPRSRPSCPTSGPEDVVTEKSSQSMAQFKYGCQTKSRGQARLRPTESTSFEIKLRSGREVRSPLCPKLCPRRSRCSGRGSVSRCQYWCQLVIANDRNRSNVVEMS